jgi:hypothetical protein
MGPSQASGIIAFVAGKGFLLSAASGSNLVLQVINNASKIRRRVFEVVKVSLSGKE